ncbi:hypothetical protein BED46_015040 [Burkholderia contaminans]|uniref:Uncharacterized protein n=1 Tax=Burkholderia contaminans TaxID=488447 RepID=A0A286P533_9BURK|nr:hypothetical protein BED46_015040 [Burkholderia contaminans]BBA37889.1 hypothetical protein BCCH1_03000 [Burkholderia contaminans]GLZ71544.1 hypothetical protein Bcon01_45890 [Burkholderia contaminans]
MALRCVRQRRHRVVALGAAQQIAIRSRGGLEPKRSASVAASEGAKCIRAREHLEVVPVELRTAREVRDVDEGARCACELDAAGDILAHAAQQRKAETHGRRRRRPFDRRIPCADVDVDGQHFNAAALRVLQQLRRRVTASENWKPHP